MSDAVLFLKKLLLSRSTVPLEKKNKQSGDKIDRAAVSHPNSIECPVLPCVKDPATEPREAARGD